MKRLALALGLLVSTAAAFAVTFESEPAAGRRSLGAEHRHGNAGTAKHERYLYVATIAQSPSDPDFVAIVGADPSRADFGSIVGRVDMPNVGDELHHFGYSTDQRRLVVPGLFSNRIHVLGIRGDGRTLQVDAVNEELAARSGYVTPHTVSPPPGARRS